MKNKRIVVWFSCGASSAVAAKIALEMFPGLVHVVYCDTMSAEHPDNARFFGDIENWLGVKIHKIKSEQFASVDEVFTKTRYMAGINGAACTAQMKKIPRFKFQTDGDVHVFGFTADEGRRIKNFEDNNPEIALAWILHERGISKKDCFKMLEEAGIALPAMYLLGYKNNNCIGCVKATSPAYWSKVRHDFPEVFSRRAAQSRDIGCRLTRVKGNRIFLDELPDGNFERYKAEDISCGPECAGGK